jgi:hypothetical protein
MMDGNFIMNQGNFIEVAATAQQHRTVIGLCSSTLSILYQQYRTICHQCGCVAPESISRLLFIAHYMHKRTEIPARQSGLVKGGEGQTDRRYTVGSGLLVPNLGPPLAVLCNSKLPCFIRHLAWHASRLTGSIQLCSRPVDPEVLLQPGCIACQPGLMLFYTAVLRLALAQSHC